MEDQVKGKVVALVIDDDMEPYWSQYGSLRSTTGHWSPSGHGAVDHDCLDATTHPIPDPTSGPTERGGYGGGPGQRDDGGTCHR